MSNAARAPVLHARFPNWNTSRMERLTFTTSHPTSVLTSVIAPSPLHTAFTYAPICLPYQTGAVTLVTAAPYTTPGTK